MRGAHFSRRLLFVGLTLVATGSAWADAPVDIATGEPAADPSTKQEPLSSDDPRSWLEGLPSTALVDSIYGGVDLDSSIRCSAAFAVLADYIEVRSGVDRGLTGSALVEALPPVARPLWQEYVERGDPKVLVGAPGRLLRTPDFRSEVLARFVAPSQVAAYESARGFSEGESFELPDYAWIVAALVFLFVVWRVKRRWASKRSVVIHSNPGAYIPPPRAPPPRATARGSRPVPEFVPGVEFSNRDGLVAQVEGLASQYGTAAAFANVERNRTAMPWPTYNACRRALGDTNYRGY